MAHERDLQDISSQLGWYSKGAKILKDDGTYEGKDSDLKVLDYVCEYYNIPSIVTLDRQGDTIS